MSDAAWRAVRDELDRARDAGRTVRFWLRDDDAVTVTQPLERLRDLCVTFDMPVLLAVIPAAAEDVLGGWIGANPSFTPCQHGYGHINHAAAGARACELGGLRAHEAVLDELAQGRQRLKMLFGPRLSDILVPPWNRIDPALIPHMAELGFETLSTFGPPSPAAAGIRHLNSDLDIIDWRGGRVGRSFADVAGRLAALVGSGQDGRAIGILTHHLAHDAQAWAALGQMLERLAAHPGAELTDAAALASELTARG